MSSARLLISSPLLWPLMMIFRMDGFGELLKQEGEGEKNHKKGGLNCVFGNFFFYVLDNCPQVQSLSEFRVYVQRIM